MEGMSSLNDEERKALLHLIKNRHGACADGQVLTETLMDQAMDDTKLMEIA